MATSILGTHLIVFDADGSKVRAEEDKIEKSTKKMAQAVDRDVQRGITNAMKAAGEATAKLGSGAKITAGDLSRLAAAAVHLERVEATDEVTTRRLARAKQVLAKASADATATMRQQRIATEDLRNATTAAGFQATSLSGAAQDLARNVGAGGLAAGIAKATVATWLANEAWHAIKKTVKSLSAEDTNAWWAEQWNSLTKFHKETKTKVYDMAFAWLAYHKARLTGDAQGMIEAAKGLEAPPINDPKSREAGQRDIDARNAANRAQTLESIKMEKERIGLERQAAELQKNAQAALNLGIVLAKLEHAESRLNGVSATHADTVRDLTIQNLRLAAANDAAAAAERRATEIRQAKVRGAALMKQVPGLSSLQGALDASAQLQGSRVTASMLATLTKEREIERQKVEAHNYSAQRIAEIMRQRAAAELSMLDELRIAYANHAVKVGDTMRAGLGHVENFLADVLTPGAIKNFGDIEDAAKSMLKSIASEIARMMANRAVMWLLGMSPAQQGAKAMNYFKTFGSLVFAKGGIAHGGFLPMKAFAAGGIVTRPTIGLVGEGRHNEAIVPLPDGKSIPVRMDGGSRVQETHVTLVMSEFAGALGRAARPTDNEIVMVVGENLLKNGVLRQIVRSAQ